MATKVGTLPKTMPSPETRETLTRGVRPFKVTYKGQSIAVDLPGYYPQNDGEGVHVGNDMSVVDRAAFAEGESGWHLGKISGYPEHRVET
jgi:HTH-type transcriptional regulator / antitoxin MqsA